MFNDDHDESSDPATWNAASYLDDPIAHIEGPAELPLNEYREAARHFLRVLEAIDTTICDSVDPWRAWCAVSLALGLKSTQGKSVTQVAGELSISKQLLSKSLRRFLKMTGLAPSFGLKTELAVQKYKICQLKENRENRKPR